MFIYKCSILAENWEFLLTMLQKSADKLLTKRKIDTLLKDAKVEKQPRIEVFDQSSAPGHVVLGRIRPLDRKPPRNKKTDSNMAFNFGSGRTEKGIVSPAVLETLPEAWTEESIKAAQENLAKLETEAKQKQPSTTQLDKKTEIIPPKPDIGKAWTSLNHWTIFGYIPNICMEESPSAIEELTKGFVKTQIEERAFVIKKHMGIVGTVIPDDARRRSFLSLLKKKEYDENSPSTPSEPDTPVSSTPDAKVDGEEDDVKKKKKRKYKKRTP